MAGMGKARRVVDDGMFRGRETTTVNTPTGKPREPLVNPGPGTQPAPAPAPAPGSAPAPTTAPLTAKKTGTSSLINLPVVGSDDGGGVGGLGGGGGGGGTTTPPAPTPTGTPSPTTTTPATTGTPTPSQPGDASILTQLERFTSRNSPMMTRARGIGAAVANQRGLQNSTLAGQAAQRAILDAAVPVASQEATLHQQRELSTQQTAAAERSAFANALMAASSSYSSNVAAIMANPDLSSSARSSAMASAATSRTADFNMIQNIYGVILGQGGTGDGTRLNWGG